MFRFLRSLKETWSNKKTFKFIDLSEKYKETNLDKLKHNIQTNYKNKNMIEILFYFHYNHLASVLMRNQRRAKGEEIKFKSVFNTSRSIFIKEISPIIEDINANGFIRIPQQVMYLLNPKKKRKLIFPLKLLLFIFSINILFFMLDIYLQYLISQDQKLSGYTTNKSEKIDLFHKFFVKKFHLTKSSSQKLSDFKGLDNVKEEIEEVISMMKYPLKYERYGAKLIKGIMLEGKPGSGKTMLARAIAGESNTNFIYVTASELQSPITGVTSLNIKELFSFASSVSPCIIFIDEIDSLLSKDMRDR
jgi:ATP-dependent Zn protease